MIHRLKHAFFLVFEKILRWAISPYLRSFLLRMLGAVVGKNTRIYESRFFNLSEGFKNLVIGDDVHIGTDVLIDLTEKVVIEKGACISPRAIIMTHSDPGSFHESPICQLYPPRKMRVVIGEYSWIGVASTVLGVSIGKGCVIGANSLVNKNIPDNCLAYGVPARIVKQGLNIN